MLTVAGTLLSTGDSHAQVSQALGGNSLGPPLGVLVPESKELIQLVLSCILDVEADNVICNRNVSRFSSLPLVATVDDLVALLQKRDQGVDRGIDGSAGLHQQNNPPAAYRERRVTPRATFSCSLVIHVAEPELPNHLPWLLQGLHEVLQLLVSLKPLIQP